MGSIDVIAGQNATALEYNNLRSDLVLGKRKSGTETDSATITFDFSDKTKGSVRTVVLGGDRTLALDNVDVDQIFVIRLVQPSASAGKTVTWFSTIKWPDGVEPTLSTDVDVVDSFGFICTGTNEFDGYIVGQNLQ